MQKSYLDFIRAEASRLAHVANVEQGKGNDTDAVALAYLGWYRLEEEGEEIKPIVKEAFGNAVFARDRRMIAAPDSTVKGFTSLTFSPDESRVLVYSMHGRLTLAASGGLILPEEHQPRPVRAAGFTADGQRLVLVGDNYWEVRDDLAETSNPQSLDAPQTHLAMHPDRMEAAIGGRDGKVHIIDLHTDTVKKGPTCVAPIRSLSYSPDGSELLIASIDGTVQRWPDAGANPNAGTGVGFPYTVTYSGDTGVLAAWANGQVSSATGRNHAGLTGAARSRDGALVTVAEDGSIMWDNRNQVGTHGKGSLSDIPLQVMFLPDNRYVAIRQRSAVRLWQVAGDTLQEIKRLTHTAGKDITGMVAHPDTSVILTFAEDGVVRLWGQDGDVLMASVRFKEEVADAGFSPGGNYVWATSYAGEAWICPVPWRIMREMTFPPKFSIDACEAWKRHGIARLNPGEEPHCPNSQ
ncbi:MAG: WD40 repeat domain-containing protein [Saprospiraceae bacterium]|nr:WD40 repeat domain-containing protein [Saprospiraceae bacterium]